LIVYPQKLTQVFCLNYSPNCRNYYLWGAVSFFVQDAIVWSTHTARDDQT